MTGIPARWRSWPGTGRSAPSRLAQPQHALGLPQPEQGADRQQLTRAHVSKVEKDRVCYETLDGAQREQEFDFAMLLPPFSGVGLRADGRDGGDITSRLFLPNDFMRVDADYAAKPYEQWAPGDWPPHVPVQSQAPPRLGPHPGVIAMAVPDSPASGSAKVTAGTAPYVTRPTRWTRFTRTFVPWQPWRFARINLKMIRIIRSSRR